MLCNHPDLHTCLLAPHFPEVLLSLMSHMVKGISDLVSTPRPPPHTRRPLYVVSCPSSIYRRAAQFSARGSLRSRMRADLWNVSLILVVVHNNWFTGQLSKNGTWEARGCWCLWTGLRYTPYEGLNIANPDYPEAGGIWWEVGVKPIHIL